MDPNSIDFTGLPPFIIEQIIQKILTPSDLKIIQKNNSKCIGVKRAAEERWKMFVKDKFWKLREDPCILPEGLSWRRYYKKLEKDQAKRQKEILQKAAIQKAKIEAAKKIDKSKSKKPKIIEDENPHLRKRSGSWSRVNKYEGMTPQSIKLQKKLEALAQRNKFPD